MFVCRVHVISTHKYSTLWVKPNPTHRGDNSCSLVGFVSCQLISI